MAIIEPSDLQLFDPKITDGQAAAMIEDALALAAIVAPCLTADVVDPVVAAAAKAIIRAAILRRVGELRMAGSWKLGSLQATPLATNTDPGSLYASAELVDLAGLCGALTAAGPRFNMPKRRPGVPEQEWARP